MRIFTYVDTCFYMRYTEAGSNKLKIEMKKIVLFFVLVIGFCVLTTESYAQKRPTKVKR